MQRAKDGDVRLRIPDALPGLLAYLDSRQRFVYANDVFERWFGLEAREVEGRHLGEVIGEAAYQLILPQVEAVLSGRAVAFEARMPYRHGGDRQVRASYTPDFAPDGGVRGWVAMVLDVTAERAIESELKRSEQCYRTLFESTLDGIAIVQDDGTLVDVNDSLCRILRAPREELIGRSARRFLPEGLTDPGGPLEVLKAQGFSQGEFPLRAADGTVVDVEWSARLGFLPGLHFCVVRDVTELRRSRESLRLQERVLASLCEGVSVWDDEGRILYANQAEEAMFGYAPGELLGQPIDLLKRQPRAADLIASLARQAGWEGELANLTRHGAPFTTHARLGPIETGGRRGWVCVEEDITERKRAESRFRAVTEVKAAFAEVGLDFEAASRAVVERLATLVGDCCTIRVLSQDGERLEPVAAHHDDPEACAWMKSLLAPEPLSADLFVTRAFKANRTLLMTGLSAARLRERAGPRWGDYLDRFAPHSIMVAPMRASGRVIGVLTLSCGRPGVAYSEEDVRIAEVLASRAAVTLESARLYEAAREANRVKDEFLATLSHELRTPLNAIVGWAHLLRADDLDEATRLKAVETINRNAEMQTRMIGDVLDVSRIVTGKLRLNTMAVDLVGVMEDSLDSIRPAAAAKGVEIRQALDPAVGQIKGDPERLQQVLWNLLSNAIRFTPSGGTITVSLHLSGGSVEIVVADDGPGIDPNFLPYAFDRFRQADSSSTRRHGGLGLGLALVRHLVELHGGTAEARNREEGGGAVFTIRLPRQVPAVQVAMSLLRRPAGMMEPVTPPKGRANINGVRVLAVDDDAGTREVIGALLERWGAEIQVAASAQDAFDKLLAGRPQVLLVDIEMPDEDGYSFLRRVRQLSAEQGGRVPAAALTAYASAEDQAKALSAGFEAHVPKPVEPAELAAVIAHLAKTGSEVGRR